MPRKKPPAGPDAGAWRVILEDMHGQMKVFGDALSSGLRGLGGTLDEFRAETSSRFEVVEAAIRQNGADIRQNSADIRALTERVGQNGTEIRGLTTRVEKLERIEERVAALEQRRR